MPSFKDLQGQEWKVVITTLELERVNELVEFDLLNLLDNQMEGLAELYDKPLTLVQVLYAICEESIEDRGLSKKDFFRRFAGDVVDAAADAVVEATALFCRRESQREILREAARKVRLGADYHLASVAEQLDALSDDEIRKSVDRSLKRKQQPSDEQTAGSSNNATEPQELPA